MFSAAVRAFVCTSLGVVVRYSRGHLVLVCWSLVSSSEPFFCSRFGFIHDCDSHLFQGAGLGVCLQHIDLRHVCWGSTYCRRRKPEEGKREEVQRVLCSACFLRLLLFNFEICGISLLQATRSKVEFPTWRRDLEFVTVAKTPPNNIRGI